MEPPSTRERVAELVTASPGKSTTALALEIGLDDTTVGYHLHRLSREGKVSPEDLGRELVWFPRGAGCTFCPVLRQAIPALRRESIRTVAYALETEPRSMHGLATYTGLRPGAVRRAVDALDGAGLVLRSRFGRVQLREGAELCREKALGAESCPEWGRCEVSRALQGKGTPK